MADDVRTVCLLGPGGSGKSRLLAAMVKAAQDGAYGYPASFALAVTPMDEEMREARNTDRLGQLILFRRQDNSPYARQVNYTETNGELIGTDITRLDAYEFEVSFRDGPAPRTELGMTVVDAAGGHIFPESITELDEGIETRKDLVERIFASTGLVIVLPFHALHRRHNVRGMEKLITALAARVNAESDPARQQLRNIAVALHQYERWFMNFGAEAADLAGDPGIAREVIRREVSKTRWLDPLRALDRSAGGRYSIMFVPTSAYGFLPGFGNPNVDPTATGNMSFHDVVPGGSDEREYVHHPFLAADPFVFAATGIANQYMTGMTELFGGKPGNGAPDLALPWPGGGFGGGGVGSPPADNRPPDAPAQSDNGMASFVRTMKLLARLIGGFFDFGVSRRDVALV